MVEIERGIIMKLLRPLVSAALIQALFAALVTPAAARAPLFDEGRGVLTLAPVLERATPAVVSVAVASRVPANDNPLLRDPYFLFRRAGD